VWKKELLWPRPLRLAAFLFSGEISPEREIENEVILEGFRSEQKKLVKLVRFSISGLQCVAMKCRSLILKFVLYIWVARFGYG
jgi:hypothetical protein